MMPGDFPTDPLLEARQLHRSGQLEAAEPLYRLALEQDRSVTEARLGLGMVLLDLGRLPQATEVLGQLVVDHPDHAAGWVQLARSIEPQGFAWEAHGAITKALKASPDADTLTAISMLLLTLGDLGGAKSAARRAVKVAPQSVYAWLQLAQVLTAAGKTAEANDAYRQALTSDPDNAVASFFAAGIRSGTSDHAYITPMFAPPEYVRSLFDGMAERFDSQLLKSLKYQTPRRFEKIFSTWFNRDGSAAKKKELTMLDAGCGTGLCGMWMTGYRGRLIGVDLSRRMLTESQLRGVYDELTPGDIADELEKRPGELDLIVAADVMVYIGDLARLFTTAAAALRPGGVLLFSVESAAGQDYILLPTHRFAHSFSYLQRLCEENGLTVHLSEEGMLRHEKGKEVRGYMLLVEKMARSK